MPAVPIPPAQAIAGVGTYTPLDSQPCRPLQCHRDLSPTVRHSKEIPGWISLSHRMVTTGGNSADWANRSVTGRLVIAGQEMGEFALLAADCSL